MKKLAALFIAILLVSAIPASAHEAGGLLGDVPLTTADIVLDGKKDEIYEQGLFTEVKYSKLNNAVKATATAYLLYKDGNLYVYADITDNDVVIPTSEIQQNTPWETDSFEVFINEKNSASAEDVKQYRVDNIGWPSYYTKTGVEEYGSGKADKYFSFEYTVTEAGYSVEFCIPVASKEIGINLQLNDMSSDGSEQTWAMVYSNATKSGPDSWEAGQYPYVTIGNTTATAAADEKAETDKADSTENSSSSTNDNSPIIMICIFIVVICVAVVIAAVIIILKIKKSTYK